MPSHSLSMPAPWLALLEAHSDLKGNAAALIADIEQRVADREKAGAVVFPRAEDRYAALTMLSPDAVRVVILGQDPYHGLHRYPDGREAPEAMGLSFSVPEGVTIPPSLRNMYKELHTDLGIEPAKHGNLTAWARQGVLLLNTILTVEKDAAKSHAKFRWQDVTAALLQALARSQKGIVFMLWGNEAQKLRKHTEGHVGAGHTLIESSHPSPLFGSANKGFFGSRPFSRANAALALGGYPAIDWRV